MAPAFSGFFHRWFPKAKGVTVAGFLNIFGILCAIALTASLVMGYMAHLGIVSISTHVVIGVVTPLAAILGLSILMFYFIATGSAVKDVAKRGLVNRDSYYETRSFKKQLFPLIIAAIALLMATPVLGAAFDARKAPLIIHSLSGWAALAVYWFTAIRGMDYLKRNMEILNEASVASDKPEAEAGVTKGVESEGSKS
ncbi:MAG: hypothetical protein HY751_12575 [Nitrospinae bacterium]|nr:hypothetical protein [Nitrospinota bacterium]